MTEKFASMVQAAIGISTVVALTVTGTVPAFAETGADASAGLIEEVAPHQGVVSEDGRGEIDGSGEIVAVSPDEGVAAEIRSPEGDLLFAVPLPDEVASAHGAVATDGTEVYLDQNGQIDVAVQVMEDGLTRVQAVMKSADAPSSQSYAIPEGFEPVVGEDGSILLLGLEGLIEVGEPWARDANGNAIDTHYEVLDGAIVQQVDADDTTVFPVVADPTWMWWSGAYGMRLTKAETKSVAGYSTVSGFCSALFRLGAPVTISCGLYGAYLFTRAKQVSGARQCLFIAAVPTPGAAFTYSGSGCR